MHATALSTTYFHHLAYLYAHAELFNNTCNGEYVILQQLAGQCLNLDRAMAGL